MAYESTEGEAMKVHFAGECNERIKKIILMIIPNEDLQY